MGLSASCARVTNARARSRVASLEEVKSQSNGSTAKSDSSREVGSSEVPISRYRSKRCRFPGGESPGPSLPASSISLKPQNGYSMCL